MRRLLLLISLFFAVALPAAAQNIAVNGFCTNGAQTVTTSGLQSSNQFYAIYPLCTVTVNTTGDGAATIFSNATGTPLSNPFTATSPTGSWTFYIAPSSTVDITMSGFGAGVTPSSFTIPAVSVGVGGGGGGSITLLVNGTTASSQTRQNLQNGANGTVTDAGSGNITINAVPSGASGQLQYDNAGAFGGTAGITTPDGNALNIKGPVPWVDATQYGVRAITTNFNTITVTTSGSTSVTTTGVSDFIKNDGIVIPQAGNATVQSTPSAPSVTVVNANGSTTLNYKCVAIDNNWGMTAASAAGTTTTAPTVFGAPATAISSISRAANVVTVTTGSNMPFSSGTFHAVIANVTGGSTQFSGLQAVTVASATSLTYSQTGANESGTVSSASYVLFENAYVVTQVQATAGDNHLVLTTDVNHNIIFVSSGTRPTMVFLDGVNFSGATPPGYANGLFPVTGVTANTITIATQYTSPTTVTAAASSSFATSAVAQMTVTTYPVIDVACPTVTGTTKYYAVYRGNTAIGFTPWLKNIFEDYGSAFTETGFVPPPAMNLPSTPPVSSQNQVYAGQITNISGSTLTVSPSVPGSVSGVTGYHDNGVALQSAVAAACSNGGGGASNSQGFSSVYLPRFAGGGATSWVYLISAPVDLSATCNRVTVMDGGTMYIDGTIYADNAGVFEWERPHDLSGWTQGTNGVAGVTIAYGRGNPMMVPGTITARVTGMDFDLLSNGEVGLMFIGANSVFQDDVFATGGNLGLTSIPFMTNTGNGFEDLIHNVYWTCDRHIQYPVPQSGNNIETGQAAWWPVPCFNFYGPQFPFVVWDGLNYGNARGMRLDNLYGNSGSPTIFVLADVQTFQAPWQPLMQVWGSNGSRFNQIEISRVQMDSIQMPDISCVALQGCAQVFKNNFLGTASDGNFVGFTGFPFDISLDILTHNQAPVQNTKDFYINTSGLSFAIPSTVTANNATTYAEGAAPTCSINNDLVWGDSGTHRFSFCNNNGSADRVVGLATTDTLTNKTLTTPTITSGGVFTGATAGVIDYAQGSTNTGASPCTTATSICDQAPTAVTSYTLTRPGTIATGIFTNNVAAAVDTQAVSGDANHSATVVLGSGSSIGATNLCVAANCPAGTYDIHVYVVITTACGTGGTYIVNLIYTDDQGAKTVPVNIQGTGTTPSTGSLALGSTSNFGQVVQPIRLTSGNIQYSTTAGACGAGGPAIGKIYLAANPSM